MNNPNSNEIRTRALKAKENPVQDGINLED
jgi:hypothetical protein